MWPWEGSTQGKTVQVVGVGEFQLMGRVPKEAGPHSSSQPPESQVHVDPRPMGPKAGTQE